MSDWEKRLSLLSPKQRALLEKKLEEKRKDTERVPSRIQKRPLGRYIPMSYAQRALWIADQLDPGSAVYNISLAMRLKGNLNVSAMESSINKIMLRHEALRTILKNKNGDLIQEISPTFHIPLSEKDLSHLSPDILENELQKILKEHGEVPFDLSNGPLIHTKLIKLGNHEHVLSVVVHHIVFDAWSLMIFLQELRFFYTENLQQKDELEELSIQYGDYTTWQHEMLDSKSIQSQLLYWKQQLKGAPTFLQLPTDRPRPEVQTFQGKQLYFILPEKLMDDLNDLSRQEDATIYMTLLTAWVTLLYRYTGQEDIVLGSPTAGRNLETQNLIGFFVNTLAIRTNLSGDPSFRELIRQVRLTALDAYKNSEIPFEMIVDALKLERSTSYSPLCQVKFIYQNVPGMYLQLPELDVQFLQTDTGTAKFDLMLDVTESPYGSGGRIEYSSELFLDETIQLMKNHFMNLLQSIVENPDQKIGALSIISEHERKGRLMKKNKNEEFKKKFIKDKPKAMTISNDTLVSSSFIDPETKMPLVVKPNAQNINLAKWIVGNEEAMNRKLIEYGGILFRGFQTGSTEEFEQFTKVIAPNLLNYNERSTPRSEVSGQVYTSTEYPADQFIPMHSELSYSSNWPMKIWFYCVKAAQEQGETPLADNRKVFELLDKKIREKFIEKKVMYVRNFGVGLDLTWQNAFQTEDPAEVERYCHSAKIEFEWLENGRLRTRQVCQAVENHPVTGETLWFNQAHLFHVSSLPEETRSSLLAVMKEEDLPRNTYYGDGSPIEIEVLDAIREAYRKAIIVFPWQEGDVLMLDNMLIAHGRNPFVGQRKVVVAMAEPYQNVQK
ncbi:hypothetical protein GCM10008014_15510 [Paenibacillus silvae]|uniref:Condensation domain-containing protein n=1 Tax=Paenibacillus silvae TaxID=1325358 RepID=A0ABQ1Z7K5_9BACL|nr:condensation domain-containing protein [Paenibacillus silvae]GGH50414.1 hypothetical protein GCM10008014_15510 [Paenibacillus silvae]